MTNDTGRTLHLGWTSPSGLWFHIGTFTAPKGAHQDMLFNYTHGMAEATKSSPFSPAGSCQPNGPTGPNTWNSLAPHPPTTPSRSSPPQEAGSSPTPSTCSKTCRNRARHSFSQEPPGPAQDRSRQNPSPTASRWSTTSPPINHVENQPPTIRLLTTSGEELGLLLQHLARHIHNLGANVRVHRVNPESAPRSLRLHLQFNAHPG